MAPVKPAARANGTVRPSDMPMTMSRTVSPAVKCRSTCGVCGIESLLLAQASLPAVRRHSLPVFKMMRAGYPRTADKDVGAPFILKLANQNQHADYDECGARDPLDPFERQVLAQKTSYYHTDCRNRYQRQRGADEDFPWTLFLSGHGHGGNLGFITHFRQENHPKSCQHYAPVHLHSLILSFVFRVLADFLC